MGTRRAWSLRSLRDELDVRVHAGALIWTFLDQASFAVSGFLLSILLARWLPPDHYGAFAVSFAAFLFFSVLHSALLIEPMMVFGASENDDKGLYLPHVMSMASCAAAMVGVLFLVGGFVALLTGEAVLAWAIFGWTLASPFVLMMWMMRRVVYLRRKPRVAAAGGLIHAVCIVALLCGLRAAGALSPWSACIAVGSTSVVLSYWFAARLGLSPALRGMRGSWAGIAVRHWAYGKWAVGASLLSWIAASLYSLLLPIWEGLEGAGALAALVSLTAPVVQAEMAVTLLLLPALARLRGEHAFMSTVRVHLGLLVAGSTCQYLVLMLFHRPIVAWVYSGQYNRYSHYLVVLGLVPVAFAFTAVLGTAWRAVEMPRVAFLAHFASALFSATAGVIAMAFYGIAGAAMAYTGAYLVTAAVLIGSLRSLEGGSRLVRTSPAGVA